MRIEKDYCDYKLVLELKELGYDYIRREGLIHLYDVQKWLREEKNIHIEVLYQPACWSGKIYNLKKNKYIKGFTFFESFEDALHTLIKETVKILKEKDGRI